MTLLQNERSETGKVRYVSGHSDLQLIVDEDNGYFRIIDSESENGRFSYVDIDGKPVDYGKIGVDEYERRTHFRIRK